MSKIILHYDNKHLAKALNSVLAHYGLSDIGHVTHEPQKKTQTLPSPIRAGKILDQLKQEQQKKRANQTLYIGPYTLSAHSHALRKDAQIITLTDIEARILRTLCAAKQSISRESLLKSVWGYRSDLDTHTVETHIYRLRQKIEPDPSKPSILRTTKSGYKLQQNHEP